MKKIMLLVACLFATSLIGINANTTAANEIVVATYANGYIDKGIWATVYVDASQSQAKITIPAPSEKITGCAPAFPFFNSGVDIYITIDLNILDLYNASSGSQATFEIGGLQDDGTTVIYKIKVIAR